MNVYKPLSDLRVLEAFVGALKKSTGREQIAHVTDREIEHSLGYLIPANLRRVQELLAPDSRVAFLRDVTKRR